MAVKRTVKKDQEPAVKYDVTVMRAKDFGEKGISLDLMVNGVKLYGAWYKTYEDRKKPGEETSFVSFASRKGTDGNWYNWYYFPINDELLQEIEKQIEVAIAE